MKLPGCPTNLAAKSNPSSAVSETLGRVTANNQKVFIHSLGQKLLLKLRTGISAF
jgi:hypothetical protein